MMATKDSTSKEIGKILEHLDDVCQSFSLAYTRFLYDGSQIWRMEGELSAMLRLLQKLKELKSDWGW